MKTLNVVFLDEKENGPKKVAEQIPITRTRGIKDNLDTARGLILFPGVAIRRIFMARMKFLHTLVNMAG